MNIGYKIKELRLKRSLTQDQLATFLSVSTQCISKWENGVTMPDIQMLPKISTFFGVTIDELFDLTDDAWFSRLETMVENETMIELQTFCQAEERLLKMERENVNDAKYPMVLARLYNHMAEGFRHLAEMQAKRAIELVPEKKYNHTLLRMAQQGSQINWNFENHSKRIDYYKDFVKNNPFIERGYVCLLDELIASKRYKEAEDVIEVMERNISTLKPIFYKGYLYWVKNDREQAKMCWNEMLNKFGDNWQSYALLGDCMANYCEYEKAVEYYEKSLKLQQIPRYTDSQISIALIYELIDEKAKAINAWEKVIEILRTEHHITEGKYIDYAEDEIKRLQGDKR